MKFKRTIASAVKDAARGIKDNTVAAYEVKRNDIRNTNLHKRSAVVLTPEEIARAERVGLLFGAASIIILLTLIALFILRFYL